MSSETETKNQNPKQTSAGANFELRMHEQALGAVNTFSTLCHNSAKFHIGFLLLFSSLFFVTLLFFPLLSSSSLIAYAIGALFLTGFSFFSIRLYINAKKPSQMAEIRMHYIEECKKIVPNSEPAALTHALYHLVSKLHLIEYQLYKFGRKSETMGSLLQKFSCYMHWKDAMKMREMLLFVAVQESIQLVKTRPVDVEAHAALANGYRKVSHNYLSPFKQSFGQILPWVPKEYDSEQMGAKFKKAAMRAIEEYKIIDRFAPKELWVHEQMASIYRDLEKPDEEIREYELICQLNPKNLQSLFRLGALYFEQGMSAKGLQIYEELKRAKDQGAEMLIALYHALSSEEYALDEGV